MISKAQVNLVPDPSFEALLDSVLCPVGDIYSTPPWQNPTGGSPNFFAACTTLQPDYSVPQNIFGYQWPHTGIGYAGLGFYINQPTPNTDYREYIQVKLSDSLKEEKKYVVSFYVSLSDSSSFGTDDIGSFFSDTAIHKDISDHSPFSSFMPQITNPQGNFLTDKANWIEILGIYTAHGGEQYITIGNFYDDANTDTLFVGGGAINSIPFAYYYIDDVSVILIPDTVPQGNELIIYNAFTPNGDGVNDVFHVKGNNIKELHAKIINRWGQELYKWNNINGGWDGKYKGDVVSAGAYFYIINVVYDDGNVEEKKGSVELIR